VVVLYLQYSIFSPTFPSAQLFYSVICNYESRAPTFRQIHPVSQVIPFTADQ